MAVPKVEYRLVMFNPPEDFEAVKALFCRVTGAHPTDAAQWVARAPGVWPWPLEEAPVRDILDGLFELGVAAEAWRADAMPILTPPKAARIVDAGPEGLSVHGHRGEPIHWIPWATIELISAGVIEAEDEFRDVAPPVWTQVLSAGVWILNRHGPRPDRRRRAMRVPREPAVEIHLVRRDPQRCFKIVEGELSLRRNGKRTDHGSARAAVFNLLAEVVARADDAYVTHPTRSLLGDEKTASRVFPSSQALLDYTTHRLLWSWYRRAREGAGAVEES